MLTLTISNTASTHALATIFITLDEDGSKPQVEWLRGEDGSASYLRAF